MKQPVTVGKTDYTVLVMMRDDAGAPATALAHTDIDIAYARVETDNDVTTADVAPADLANLTAAHSDWGWEVVSATDHPGLYRLDIADAVFASGAWSAVVSITGTGLDPTHLEFLIVGYDPFDAGDLGLTALSTNLIYVTDVSIQKVINPTSSTDTFRIEFNVKDHNGALVAPDANPTVTLVDHDGSDVSARLDDTTPAAVSTGYYRMTYTSNVAHAAAQLTMGVSVTKSGYTGDVCKFPIILEAAPATAVALASVDALATTAASNSTTLVAGVNVSSVNDIEITGAGTEGNPFAPA